MSEETRLSVRLPPRASTNAVLRYDADVLYLRLTAPPVEGAATPPAVPLSPNYWESGYNKLRL